MKVSKKTKKNITQFIRDYIKIRDLKDIDFSTYDYNDDDFDIIESVRCIGFHLKDIVCFITKDKKLINELWNND